MSKPREFWIGTPPGTEEVIASKMQIPIEFNPHLYIEKSAYDWQKSEKERYEAMYQVKKIQADKLAEVLELHLKFFELKTGQLVSEDLFREMQSMSTAKQAIAEYRGER